MVADADSLACFSDEGPWCNQKRLAKFVQSLGSSFGGEHGVSRQWLNRWVSIYFEMPKASIPEIAHRALATLKTDRMSLLTPTFKSIYLKNRFPLSLFIAAFCSVVLRNRMENHNVTLVKLTLQGSTTSTCIIPRGKKASLPGSCWEYHHETNKDMQIGLFSSSFA